MSRFTRYALVALMALAGPTWLGQVGVAAAAYRPIGIDRADSAFDLSKVESGSSGGDQGDAPAEPPPGRRPFDQLRNSPAHDGASTNSVPPSASSGSVPATLGETSVPPPEVEVLLRVARESLVTPPRLESVFEPPRHRPLG